METSDDWLATNLIRKCVTLETITDKFHWKADEKYFWYYKEDAKEVKDAIYELGRERVSKREERLGNDIVQRLKQKEQKLQEFNFADAYSNLGK